MLVLLHYYGNDSGFRNVLAHNYVDLNLNLVYDNLEKGIPAFKKYARYIAKYLVKK